MPKKKKGKGGKKKKKTLSRGDGDAPEDGDGAVNTAMGALQADGTLAATGDGKKKKKKKKKLTKSERAALKLEKAINAYMSQEEHYRNFVDTMHAWLTDKKNADRMTQLFAYFDTRGENHVTYDEFKAGMRDLNIPCNVLELHILAKLLDKEDLEEIDYTELPKGLKFIREAMDDDSDSEEEEEEAEEVIEPPAEGNGKPQSTTPMQLLLGQTPQDKPVQDRPVSPEYEKIKLIMSQRKLPACAGCKMGISEPYKPRKSKYIQLELKLATFANLNKPIPVNLNKLLPVHTTVAGLVSLVVNELHVSSSTIAIFKDTSREPEMALDPGTTLEENGYPGGTYDRPQHLTLYYDYIVEFRDCPLLMCDHYMRKVPMEQIMKSIKR